MTTEKRIVRAGQAAKQDKALVPKMPKLEDEITLAAMLKQYTETVGLPIQATPAIAKAYKVRQSLMHLVEQQSGLPQEERRSLVTIERGKVLTDKSLSVVDRFCVNNAIPYNLVAWIENGPYPLTDARYYHVVMDPRGLKNIEFREDKLDLSGSSPIAIYSCRISFWDESYIDWETGACSLSEIRANPTIHGMITRAKTRAFNRAANRCIVFIGAVPPQEEGFVADDTSSLLAQTPPSQVVIVQPPTESGSVPNSWPQIFNTAYQRWGIDRPRVAEIMGVTNTTLMNLNKADVWAKLEEWALTKK